MMRERVGWARGFWAGIAGGVAAAIVLFAYRFATGMPTMQEALAERMIRLLPYPVFGFILDRLQHLAKPLGFAMAIATSIIGFGLGGVLYAWATRRSRWPRPALGVATAVIAWLFLTFVFLPLIEGGLLGAPLTTVVTAPALPMAAASLAYGLLLALLYDRPRRDGAASATRARVARAGGSMPAASTPRGGATPETVGRRDLLRRSALVVLAAAAGTALAGWAESTGTAVARAAGQAFRLLKGMPPEITPDGRFYQVSKNFFDPTVDVHRWALEVSGLVNKPLRLSLDEFTKAAPSIERDQTLECISNEVGGDLISTARWKGLRMKDVLDLAGVKDGATTVVMRAVDNYTESLPLAVAMDPTTLLAYEMNGAPLPQKHGAPVRVLVFNRYGMKGPKWITGIEVANRDYTGYWELQGWSKQAIVKTNSAFRVETKDGAVLALGGWAFAGDRGISKVEVSPDGGKTWIPAALKPPLGPNCWQFWSLEWKPPANGGYTLKVRAVDGTGSVQPEKPEPTLPDGGQGYHTVRVQFG